VPLRRAGGAEAVAGAVLYFLREDFATGAVLPVDGGEYL
jgi:NAD(P)-dependent dehydrogenase (short-subunit alcohol dehydrogenase family)